MKKNIFFLSLILLLSIASGSCKRISNKNETKEVILASFTVLADIISNVAKDDFIVRSITKPGVEVHGYQPTPSDLVNASNAFVFIDNGFGFELWAEKFVSNLKVRRITVAEDLDPIFISEDFYKGKPNPHAWISPKRGILYVDILVDSLSELRPSKRTLFEKNGEIVLINSHIASYKQASYSNHKPLDERKLLLNILFLTLNLYLIMNPLDNKLFY